MSEQPKTELRLELTVAYAFEEGDERPDLATCKQLLDDLVATAANRGMLSGNHEFVVDSYDHKVVELPEYAGNMVINYGGVQVYQAWKGSKGDDLLSDAWYGTYDTVDWESPDAFDVRDMFIAPVGFAPEGVDHDKADMMKFAWAIESGSLTEDGYKAGPCMRIEYDPNYAGGEYADVGLFLHVPLSYIDKIKGDSTNPDADETAMHVAFEKMTGLAPVRIVHYTFDDLYHESGEDWAE